jgi:hypothetical protein
MTDILLSIASVVFFLGTPYALILAQRWVNTLQKNSAEQRWAAGALSFAGQTYVALANARRANPNTPLPDLVKQTVPTTARNFYNAYIQTASTLDANMGDATSRVTGALGTLLAADPTVTLAPSPVPVPANPPLELPRQSTLPVRDLSAADRIP